MRRHGALRGDTGPRRARPHRRTSLASSLLPALVPGWAPAGDGALRRGTGSGCPACSVPRRRCQPGARPRPLDGPARVPTGRVLAAGPRRPHSSSRWPGEDGGQREQRGRDAVGTRSRPRRPAAPSPSFAEAPHLGGCSAVITWSPSSGLGANPLRPPFPGAVWGVMTLSHGVLRPGAEWSPLLVSGEPAGLCIPPSGVRLPTGPADAVLTGRAGEGSGVGGDGEQGAGRRTCACDHPAQPRAGTHYPRPGRL